MNATFGYEGSSGLSVYERNTARFGRTIGHSSSQVDASLVKLRRGSDASWRGSLQDLRRKITSWQKWVCREKGSGGVGCATVLSEWGDGWAGFNWVALSYILFIWRGSVFCIGPTVGKLTFTQVVLLIVVLFVLPFFAGSLIFCLYFDLYLLLLYTVYQTINI